MNIQYNKVVLIKGLSPIYVWQLKLGPSWWVLTVHKVKHKPTTERTLLPPPGE